MGLVVGGKGAWRVKRKGDIAIAFHWVNKEPAMVLFPARPNTLGATACVIPLASAHAYAQPNGYPTQYCIAQAAKYAALMGMYTDRFTIHRIADAILENIEDLLDMPPEPRQLERERQGRVIGEVTLKSGGKQIGGGEVTEDHGVPAMSIDSPGTTLH
jgi:hypothetical protein